MSNKLSEEKLELIRKIAENEGITEFTTDVQVATIKGDNYLGIIDTVDVKNKKQPQNTLHLILKSAQTNDNLREKAPVKAAYEREILMYQTIFPEMFQLQEENGVKNRFVEIPKFFGSLFTEKEECLVFLNMKEIGYKLWDRMKPMDMEHAKIVFKTYGKFHALSFILKHHKPERFQELTKDLVNVMMPKDDKEKEEAFKQFANMFESALKAVAGNEKATEVVKNLIQNMQAYFEELRICDEYSVIDHGDCWCNNMLFKFEDPEDPLKPTKMCLLDWQIANFGSPILDLAYFLSACCPRNIMNEFESLLKIYHEALSLTLREAQCDPEKLFPYSVLRQQWQKNAKFGFYMAPMIMKVMLSESDEAADLSEWADSGRDILEAFTNQSDIKHEEMYLKRIADVIEFLMDHGFI